MKKTYQQMSIEQAKGAEFFAKDFAKRAYVTDATQARHQIWMEFDEPRS